MKCVSDTRNDNSDRCPSRCSSPFLVDRLPQLQLEFYCPYNPSDCPGNIFSVQQFDNHYRKCAFVSEQTLAHRKLVNEYRCLKGHYLEFFIGSYQEMTHSRCQECQQTKLCRSFCRICQQFYCVGCRMPPCSKQGCPIGHGFTFQRIPVINFICDVCGISTAVSNGGVYDDNLCNFGICELCYNQLPEKYDQSKPRSIVANINTECQCGGRLEMVECGDKSVVCELCRRQKECARSCGKCGNRYCVGCKLFDIYSDGTCLQDHEMTKVSKQNLVNGEEMRQQSSVLLCMRCNKQF